MRIDRIRIIVRALSSFDSDFSKIPFLSERAAALKEISKASVSGRLARLVYASQHMINMKMDKLISTGRSLIPKGV